ncbi:MAG: hypothetical protein HY520_02290 [Candidatus Aenigmarchaeota archaeon]|nr:hypothetical protein [Candidatus Aenigmarchaeota archaeon]
MGKRRSVPAGVYLFLLVFALVAVLAAAAPVLMGPAGKLSAAGSPDELGCVNPGSPEAGGALKTCYFACDGQKRDVIFTNADVHDYRAGENLAAACTRLAGDLVNHCAAIQAERAIRYNVHCMRPPGYYNCFKSSNCGGKADSCTGVTGTITNNDPPKDRAMTRCDQKCQVQCTPFIWPEQE